MHLYIYVFIYIYIYIYLHTYISEKVICKKDASEEGECRNVMQNMVCSVCPVITK